MGGRCEEMNNVTHLEAPVRGAFRMLSTFCGRFPVQSVYLIRGSIVGIMDLKDESQTNSH